MHVRAVLREQAARHPPQAVQRHHVIEPQRCEVPHVVADQADERLILLRAQLVRILRRNAPVLAFQRERIGRRADGRALAIQVTVRPRLGAGGVGADRDVAVQADRHAELARARLRLAQLLGREPLQVEEVLDVLHALAREAIDDRRRRIAIVLRPAGPAPVLRPLQAQVRIERIVDRMQAQRLALHFDEAAERLRALRCRCPGGCGGSSRTGA